MKDRIGISGTTIRRERKTTLDLNVMVEFQSGDNEGTLR